MKPSSRSSRSATPEPREEQATENPSAANVQLTHDEKIDQLAHFWQRVVAKDKRQYANKMDRIRRDEEAPPPVPLYMSTEQQALHRLVFHYVEGLQVHEERVERQKAIHDTRTLLQTVVLMEKHNKS